MIFNKKFTSHAFWILLAVAAGIGISHLEISGFSTAYSEIYGRIQESISKEKIPPIQALPEGPHRKEPEEQKTAPLPETGNAITIGFVGDIVPALDAFPDIFSDVTAYTAKPDIMIGNLEGAITKDTHNKCEFRAANCFSFNGDDKFLTLLSNASFDVLNVANNHFDDYRETGEKETLANIQKAGMTPSGVKGEVAYLTKNNLKIGIIGFSTYEWTNDLNNAKEIEKIVSTARENADIVVVVFHGGGEGVKYSHVPLGVEWYLAENRGDLRSFAHKAVDAGADLVMGSGPHVLRGIEEYKGKLIAYSLGNFASSDAILTTGSLKTSAMIEATFKKDGSWVSGNIYPFQIDVYGIPHPDPKSAAISMINELSKSDFGKDGVILNSAGEILNTTP